MFHSIFKYQIPNKHLPNREFTGGFYITQSDWREDKPIHTPASYSLQNRQWIGIYGGFAKSYPHQTQTEQIYNPRAEIGPHAVSPDGSKIIFGRIVDFRLQGWVPGFYTTPTARPYLGPLGQLPAPIIAVNDAGVIVGSFASQPWWPILEHPYVYANQKLVYLTPHNEVLGVSNLAQNKPMTVIGSSGIWCQKVVPSTGLPMDLSKGSNAFSYKTYAQLDPENRLGLTNIQANCASKEGTTLALNGINSAGQTEYITALFLPVEVVNADKKPATELEVSKMDVGGFNTLDAFGKLSPGASDECFYVRVKGTEALGPISVKVSTTDNPDASYNDNATQINLTFDGNEWISESMIMVSDDVDDDQPVNSIADDATNDRTHKIQLGGNFKIGGFRLLTNKS